VPPVLVRRREEAVLSTLQAIILGIVQGATEFAPVSSSGHLILVPWLFNWTFLLENPELNKTFDVALHVGTFIGALGYFWRDIVRYLKAWFRSIAHRAVATTDERLAWCLVIGTIPGVVLGVALEGFVEDKLGQPWLIAVNLAVFGVVLYVVDRFAGQQRELKDVRLRDAALVGTAQALALAPGVSRSGATITMGRGLRLDRETATRFSFLLSLPIIAGAGLYQGAKVAVDGLPPGTAAPFLWGMLSAAVSGFLVISFLLSYVRRGSFAPFVVYRLALAALVFALIVTGVRPATI
jgi:undecaprenyl-diphosphatase